MEITIKLDPEHARQLAAVQQYTNQDLDTVIQQGIGLYHQQVQPHYQLRMDLDRKYSLVCNVSANALAEHN
jgi:hypothetical protein